MSYEKLLILNPVDCQGNPIDLTQAPELALCSDLAAGGFTIEADPSEDQTTQFIANGDLLTVIGGLAIRARVTALDTLTLSLIASELPQESPLSDLSGGGIVVSSLDNGSGGLASPCDVFTQLATGAYDSNSPVNLFQGCTRLSIASPDCSAAVPNVAQAVLGFRDFGLNFFRTAEQRLGRVVAGNTTLDPAADYVLLVNTASGNVTITLGTPDACDPRVFHIKKTSPDANDIILDPVGAIQIENATTYTFDEVIGLAGGSREIFYDEDSGAWWVI